MPGQAGCVRLHALAHPVPRVEGTGLAGCAGEGPVSPPLVAGVLVRVEASPCVRPAASAEADDGSGAATTEDQQATFGSDG